MIRLWQALIGASLLAIAGCQAVDTTADLTASAPASLSPTVGSEIRLAPGDKLRVTVFGEDKLSGEYQIDGGGLVSLPLAGSVQAAGLTKPELERQLARKLQGDFLKNPRVTVDVTSFRPFYILGEVEKPGEYQPKSGLNVVSAIAIAGGATYRASKSYVLIQRGGTGPFQEFPLQPTVPVMPGDLVRVPERFF